MLATCLAVQSLAACGSGDNGPGPDEMTVGEARALDEAAEMLDEQRLPPEPAAVSHEATAPLTVQ